MTDVLTSQARKQKRQVIFKRAEQYVKEYKAAEREQIRLRRLAKSQGDFFVPTQPRVAFVIRLRGISNIPPKPRKIMQLLRLRQINNGVFVKLTAATQQMLQLISPYVTWGEPNLKSIRELIYKRGFAKINKQRISRTTPSLRRAWASMVSSRSKTSSTRLPRWAPTSRLLTCSCGHSSSRARRVASRRGSSTTTLREVSTAIVSRTSTASFAG